MLPVTCPGHASVYILDAFLKDEDAKDWRL